MTMVLHIAKLHTGIGSSNGHFQPRSAMSGRSRRLPVRRHAIAAIIARRSYLYAVQALRRRCCSIRTQEVSHSELDLTVGKLPPFLDNRHVPDLLTWLTEDFASFAAGCFDRQRKYF
jgi:hypothetical protein